MTPKWPDGVDRLILDEVDSTNRFVAGLGREGKGPIWVMTRRQSASRGRRGRAWSFQEGNFAASLLLWPDKPIDEIAQMSFVAALALFDTVAMFTQSDSLALKWPNDLLLDGKKLSGILLETVEYDGSFGLVVGIGVNLAHAPNRDDLEDRAMPAVALDAHSGVLVQPDAFLDVLAPNMNHWQGLWQADGFVPIREAWLARATGLGSRVTARLPDKEYEGVFEDIDAQGSLVLWTKTSRMALPAADIYFSQKL